MSAQKLLDRLDGVRQSGHGKWMAKCPAHEDGSPSLAIRETEDGRVLIHCFAECDPLDVLGAVGLNIRDLFPAPLTPHANRDRKPKLGVSPTDVMRAMNHETVVLFFLAESFAEGIHDPALCARAQLAASRVRTAFELCNG